MQPTDIVGLDWEGVITEYPTAMAALVQRFSACVIITQMRSLTSTRAARYLQTNPRTIQVEICPCGREGDYQEWKAEMCMKHRVSLYLDDDPTVVQACKQQHIPAVLVGRIPEYVQQSL